MLGRLSCWNSLATRLPLRLSFLVSGFDIFPLSSALFGEDIGISRRFPLLFSSSFKTAARERSNSASLSFLPCSIRLFVWSKSHFKNEFLYLAKWASRRVLGNSLRWSCLASRRKRFVMKSSPIKKLSSSE